MMLGLDLGTSTFRVLKRMSGRLIGRRVAATYAAIPDSPSRRQLLQQARISFLPAEGFLVVTGQEAESVAESFNLPLLSLLPEAQLQDNDPVARQLLARCVEALAPCVAGEPAACTLTLPGGIASQSAHAEFLQRILRLLNYVPEVMPATQAVGLAELGREGFSGLTLNFGAGQPSIGLLHRGRMELCATSSRGGDWIDRRLAERRNWFVCDPEGQRYLDLAAVRRWKHSSSHLLLRPSDDHESTLAELYGEAVEELCATFASECERHSGPLPTRGAPIICHGGGALVGDFADLLRERWSAAGIPIALSGVRVIPDDEWSVARGCLIHCEVERTAQTRRTA